MRVCFPFDADEPAEAVLHTHGRVFNSADLGYPPKHVSFSCFVKILGVFSASFVQAA